MAEVTVMKPSDEGTSSTTERVIRTYLALVSGSSEVGITDLATATGMSKAVVHRIIGHFVDYGLAARNPVTRRYSLGPKSFALAEAVRPKQVLSTCARPFMEYLYELTGETITLTQRVNFHHLYVSQIESPHEIHISVALGTDVPLTVGSCGLCQLAFLDQETIDLILRIPRKKYTDATVTDDATIRARLDDIRRDGYSVTSGERVSLCTSIATPILAGNHNPIGSLGVACLDSRFPLIDRQMLIQETKRAASQIGKKVLAASHPTLP
ncbi:MAG: IclR family transcriptional regulator [Bifidobacterium aquikefiri]|nr:IclR family transcriptional regulator [Bifidobacterium aquikefiri]